jgi:C-terminal processing protease CtpA/Prc
VSKSTQFVSIRKLDGNVADIEVSAFAPGVADAVLQAISRLGGRKLHGVILDLRGDTGGLPTEVSALLGAFVHDKAYSYDCTVRGSCTTNYVDNTTRSYTYLCWCSQTATACPPATRSALGPAVSSPGRQHHTSSTTTAS